MVNVNVTRKELVELIMKRTIAFMGITNGDVERLRGVSYEDNVCAHFVHPNGPGSEDTCRSVHLYYNTDDPSRPVLMVDVTGEDGKVSPRPYTPIALMARLLWGSVMYARVPLWWKPMLREWNCLLEDLS